MNKLLNKRQIIILSVMSIITATLALCMWAAGVFSASVPASGNEAQAWETSRDPRPSLNENILWETRIGGTGKESLLAAFSLDDRIVIFGNTESSDCDFAQGSGLRGFIATLSDKGVTESFCETAEITAVSLHDDGFLLGLANPVRLRLIDFDLAAVNETPLYGDENERVRDILLTDDGYTVITAVNDGETGADSLKIIKYDRSLKKISSRVLARSARIQYIDSFAFPDRTVVAVNFDFGAVQCMSLIVAATGSPLYYDITTEGGYRACDVIPYENGFAALILSDGNADILTVNEKYEAAKKIYLNSAECSSGKLFVSDENIYAYVHKQDDMSKLYTLDGALNYIGSVSQANTLTAAHAQYNRGEYTNLLCSSADKTVILSLGPTAQTLELKVETLKCLWLKTRDGLVIVAEALYGEDCGNQIGDADIALIRLT